MSALIRWQSLEENKVNWNLEVVCVPVTDVDRAKEFYANKVGFKVDYDSRIGDKRSVQLTPHGSGCSIAIGKGITTMKPGDLQDIQLVVRDLRAAHAQLVKRGVEVSEIQVYDEEGELHPAKDDDDLNNMGFIFFKDPEGNGWAIQEISSRP